jgi:peptidyl-prolyl cis-trans isomerase C
VAAVAAMACVVVSTLVAQERAASPDARVVAEVAGRSILASDLQEKIASDRRQAVAENRLDAFGSKAAATALDQLIDVKLFAAAARDEGLLDRADVRHEIERLIDDLLAQTLVSERAQRVPLDEAAMRRYYDANPREFETPGRVRARHIVVRTEAEATALLGRLRRNADFVALARANNIDSTRDAGGDLGLVARGVMVEAFDRALFSLQVGEVSPVVQTPYGFHIVKVEGIEPPQRKPFNTVAGEVRQKMLQAEVQAWKTALLQKHPVRVHEHVLKSIR